MCWCAHNEGAWGSGVVDLLIGNLRPRWEWSASRLGRFSPEKKNLCYPLNRRFFGLQSGTDDLGSKKQLFPLPRIKPQFIGRLALSLIAVPIEMSPSLSTLHH